MAARQDVNFYALSVFLVAFSSYLFYHAFSGERGVAALIRIDQMIHEKQQELDRLAFERRRMENRVQHMRTESLDTDLLEEQARKVLGYAKPGEFILVTDENN